MVAAIASQNVQVAAAGRSANGRCRAVSNFSLLVNTLGQLIDPDQFANIITSRAGSDGTQATMTSTAAWRQHTVRRHRSTTDQPRHALRRASRGHRAAQRGDSPRRTRVQAVRPILHLNGKPSVALVASISCPDRTHRSGRQRLYQDGRTEDAFPDGLDYQIDLRYPRRSSANRKRKWVKRSRDAVILVAIVVLFFLQDWRAMILPMIDVPVSLIGTLAVMSQMGFTPQQPDTFRPGTRDRNLSSMMRLWF